MSPTFSARGQESAPFELLIAVILMGFVLFAGFQAIQQLEEQTCTNKINAQLGAMARTIQNVVTGKGSSQFTFSFDSCNAKINDCDAFSASAGTMDIQCIELSDTTDPNICSSYCSSARSVCSLLVYRSSRFTTNIKCVDISPSTVFPAGGSQCPDLTGEGWVLQDFSSQTIQMGTYKFLKASELTATVPIVCAYLRNPSFVAP